MIVNLTGDVLRIEDLKPGEVLTWCGSTYLMTDRCAEDQPRTVWCVNLATGHMKSFNVKSANFDIVRDVALTGTRGRVVE